MYQTLLKKVKEDIKRLEKTTVRYNLEGWFSAHDVLRLWGANNSARDLRYLCKKHCKLSEILSKVKFERSRKTPAIHREHLEYFAAIWSKQNPPHPLPIPKLVPKQAEQLELGFPKIVQTHSYKIHSLHTKPALSVVSKNDTKKANENFSKTKRSVPFWWKRRFEGLKTKERPYGWQRCQNEWVHVKEEQEILVWLRGEHQESHVDSSQLAAMLCKKSVPGPNQKTWDHFLVEDVLKVALSRWAWEDIEFDVEEENDC